MKLNKKIIKIRSDHKINFENAKFNEFYDGFESTITSLLQKHLNRIVLVKEKLRPC